MACPGSVGLSAGIIDEESDHAAIGTAAHALGEMCLTSDTDAWEHLGWTHGGWATDKHMADAVQQYLDKIRELHPDRNQSNFFVERGFHCPSIHELFYGTSDAIFIDEPTRTLHVHDYKNGAGIVVEVKENPQGMYYACGALEELGLWGAIERVVIHIHQPNGFHFDGPHRTWELSTLDLFRWLWDVLRPAMDHAMVSRDTKSGEHCRFCPARSHACPQLMQEMDELETMMALMNGTADELKPAQVSRFLDLLERAKIVGKAASNTAFRMMNAGVDVPGWGLVKARANRVFKDGAAPAAKAKFGPMAYSKPALLSPAQMEELPEGKAFVAQWAHKPDAGLTVAKSEDARPKVNKDTKSMFEAATQKRKAAAK
jgi:hypothetical protein